MISQQRPLSKGRIWFDGDAEQKFLNIDRKAENKLCTPHSFDLCYNATTMAVLHITYKHDPQISKADYDGFYKVITSYQWRRLSDSNWTIDAEDPPQAIWQKFKRYID